VIITKLQIAPVDLDVSASRVRRVERVELCCLTSSTQPKCMDSTRRTCRVVSSRAEPSGIWPIPGSSLLATGKMWTPDTCRQKSAFYQKTKSQSVKFWTSTLASGNSSLGAPPQIGQCYYPSMRTENKGLLALFFVRQERRIDCNFKWAITGTRSLSAISI